ncbi:MAG: glycoside hydrolase family 3 C-terminal domain-containing protein [Lachnospiraceae bacterium]|nr:glycoside hydrolase family 3 C-terminal domain-containing protein [Lachnospiraceae bacterium]
MKHKELIKNMTLEEKAAILGGHGEWDTWEIKRLHIPAMILSDGPHGVRRQAGAGDHLGLNASLPATCFPTAATMANSWNPKLGEEVGEALGEEALAEDVNILLGPGMNIKRSPLCGRNFEYFSEDPYLAGKMASGYVRGLHKKGVYACIKHFAVNSQEERRMAMNAVVDERTLREIYLTGFEIAVKEGGAKCIMSSYNELNGEYTNESRHLLTDILRKDWGFDGMVVTDWGGSNDHTDGVIAGSNLEMPNPGLASARELIESVKSGRLPESVMDERVDELLDAILTVTKNAEGHGTKFNEQFDVEAHHALAHRAAAECAVLLKNEDGILPLSKGTKVAVVGDFAYDPRYQGAGSSMVNKTKLDTVVEQIRKESDITVVGTSRGYRRDGEPDPTLLSEAKSLAGQADVVLYFFGLNEISESEGLDRTHMRIPQNQIQVLEALSKTNANVVGIISAGSSIEMPWEVHCKAILHGYLTGQAGAGAQIDLLLGRANPSGKLAETYPQAYEDTPAFAYYPAKERNSDYREGLFVGYRYYDTSGTKVRYPFGFGLSYTSFAYSDLSVDKDGATFTITNTGERDGAEIAQMYIALPDPSVFRPKKELKGFAKVFLKAGESKKITIPFDEYSFRYWNMKTNAWAVEGGVYQIMIGGSSADLPLVENWKVEDSGAPNPYQKAELPSYYSGRIKAVPDAEFARILGRAVPSGKWEGLLSANDAICQLSYAKSGIGRFVFGQLEKRKKKADASGKPDLNILFIYNMPFRAIAKMTAGAVDMHMVEGMVDAVNGHFWKGIGKIVSGYFKNQKENKRYEKRLSEER